MTKGQTAKVNMFIAMMLFFTKYEATLASFLQLVTEITGFTGTYAGLNVYYWMRWVNSRNEKGSWGPVFSAYVQG